MWIKKPVKSASKNYVLIQDESGPSRILITDGPFVDVKFIFGKVSIGNQVNFEYEILDSSDHFLIKDLEANKGFTDYIFQILLELLEANIRFKYGIQ